MEKSIALLVLAASACLVAQPKPPKVSSVRLYVFDLGTLKSGNPKPLLDRGVTVTDMSLAAFLIVHPRGTLMWDTGAIPDELIQPGGATEARATTKTTLRSQLAGIGYQPSEITYLALSHNHYDHSANANEFAGATWLVQKPERDVMFPATPAKQDEKQATTASRYSALKNSKTKILNGDYDVFGDGSVMILSTPGHTPGHQSLLVNLKKTGAVVLSGDLYHYPSERTLPDFTHFGNPATAQQEAASRAKVEALLKEKHAQIWIQHDILAFPSLKKSPEYYE